MNQYIIILDECFTRDIQVLPENSFVPENGEYADVENDWTSFNEGEANIMLGIVEAGSKEKAIIVAAGKFGFSADKLVAHELARDINKLSNDLSNAKKAIIANGFDPTAQLVRFIISNDPVHIVTYNGARENLCAHNRYEILNEVVSFYLEQH